MPPHLAQLQWFLFLLLLLLLGVVGLVSLFLGVGQAVQYHHAVAPQGNHRGHASAGGELKRVLLAFVLVKGIAQGIAGRIGKTPLVARTLVGLSARARGLALAGRVVPGGPAKVVPGPIIVVLVVVFIAREVILFGGCLVGFLPGHLVLLDQELSRRQVDGVRMVVVDLLRRENHLRAEGFQIGLSESVEGFQIVDLHGEAFLLFDGLDHGQGLLGSVSVHVHGGDYHHPFARKVKRQIDRRGEVVRPVVPGQPNEDECGDQRENVAIAQHDGSME
mmetsp:Transcript_9629/g.23344  ORF Transcript_9629/g.23344 Transcript_9629/m.23344 type:complete len:276 (-) Transcript_9629:186-1013(-)